MARELPDYLPTGMKSAADLSALTNQYRELKVTGVDLVNLCGAGELGYGTLQNQPGLNEAAQIMRTGQSKGLSGAAFAVSAKLMCDANGKYITATSGNHVVAQALEAATGADQLVTIEKMVTAVPLA